MGTFKKTRVTLYLFLLTLLVVFLPNSVVAQTTAEANLASPNSIVFQLRAEETKYAEGDWVKFIIEVTNLWTTQDTMYLSLYFPHIYEQLLGNDADQKFFEYNGSLVGDIDYRTTEDGDVVEPESLGVELIHEEVSKNDHGFDAIDSLTWKINGMERNASIFMEFRVQILAPLEFEDKTLAANLGLMMFDANWDPYPTYSGFTLHILQSPCAWFHIVHSKVTPDNACFFGEPIEFRIRIIYIAQENLDPLNITYELPDDAIFINSNPSPIAENDSLVVWQVGEMNTGDTDTLLINYWVTYTGIPDSPPYELFYQMVNSVRLSWTDGSYFCSPHTALCNCLLPYSDFEPLQVRAVVGDGECASPGYPVTLVSSIFNHARSWDASNDLSICFFDQSSGQLIGTVAFTDTLGYEKESDEFAVVWDDPPENPETVVQVVVNCDTTTGIEELNFDNNEISSEPFCVAVTELNANMYSLGYSFDAFGIHTRYPETILGFWHIFDQNFNPIHQKADTTGWLSQDQYNNRDEQIADVFDYAEQRLSDSPQSWQIIDFSSMESMDRDNGFRITVLVDENSQNAQNAAADFISQLPDKDNAELQSYTGNIIPVLQSSAQAMTMLSGQRFIYLFATATETSEADSIHHISDISREFNIPVYGVALGNENSLMQEIADSTMGYCWNVASNQATSLNAKLVDILHNCYALHYSAPYSGEYFHYWHQLDGVVRYEDLITEDKAWYLEPFGDPDLSISKMSTVDGEKPDSSIIMSTDVITYSIAVRNQGIIPVGEVVIQDILPDRMLVDEATIVPAGSIVSDENTDAQMVIWENQVIPADSIVIFTFNCQLDASWSTLDMCSEILNVARIDTAAIDQNLSNNTAMDVLTVMFDYENPVLYADKAVYMPHEAVSLGFILPAPCTDWRVIATLADGSTNEFSGTFDSTLTINDSLFVLAIDEGFTLTGNELVEDVIFTLYVTDICGLEKTAETTITLEAQEYWHLSHNAYNVNREADLFSTVVCLAWESDVEIKILDLSGKLIKDYGIVHQDVGESSYTWDRTDESGRTVGAGIYVVTLNSDNLQGWKKFVLVQ